MKILFVDNSTWNIYNFRQHLLQRLQREGHELYFAAPSDRYLERVDPTFRTRFFPVHYLLPRGKNPFHDLQLFIELSRLYRHVKPDLVIHYTIKPNIFGSFAACWVGIPSIAILTGLGYSFLHRGPIHFLVSRLYRQAFRFPKKIVFYNEDDRQQLVRTTLIDPAKTLILPGSGVDAAHFAPSPLPSERTPFHFLFIGRLIHDKGIREYVEASAILAQKGLNVQCQIIGELHSGNPTAISETELRQWTETGLINYLGLAEDVRPYIQQAHVVVLPSYREGIPKSLLEAMAMARPIVTTDAPGCKETVEDGINGLSVPVKNARALAEAMEKMHSFSLDTLTAMGQAGRKRVFQYFEQSIVAERFMELVKNVKEPKL
ncbi:MAG TPA: glycosyltransferase family 4 protein [Saprospiraceae bacterium]|nr:glycosyltransferase family 4 protein [Saprospiraceae bacterium]HMQ81454.1 glycosyltransferase family 4 protein [Saprospiraceae bacterium]